MKKIKLFILPILGLSAIPVLAACQSIEELKLEKELKNLSIEEKESPYNFAKTETLPSSLDVLDFKSHNDKEFGSKLWIQSNDQEGKVDVFARLEFNEIFSKIKKFSFENYHAQKIIITSDQQLNEILESLSVDFKIDKAKIIASEITSEDIFVIKGENILDSSYDIDMQLLANEHTSELLVEIVIKKDGFVSNKKQFLVNKFQKWENVSKKALPKLPANWPQPNNKKELTTFASSWTVGSILNNALEMIDLGKRINSRNLFQTFPEIENEELKDLPQNLQESFKKYFVNIKNIAKKLEFLGTKMYSNLFAFGIFLSLPSYTTTSKVVVNELKILLAQMDAAFVELAQSFDSNLDTEQIKEQLSSLEKINGLINDLETTVKNRGAVEVVEKIFNDTTFKNKNFFDIKILRSNCPDGVCQSAEDKKDFIFNLSLIYGQMLNAVLKSSYTYYANSLAAHQPSVDAAYLESFKKTNSQLLTTITQAQLPVNFVQKVAQMKKFYEELKVESELQKFKNHFEVKNKVLTESLINKLSDIELNMLEIEKVYTKAIAKTLVADDDKDETSEAEYSISYIIKELDKNLKETSTTPISTANDFSKFFKKANNADYYIIKINQALSKAQIAIEKLNKAIAELIPELETIKSQTSSDNSLELNTYQNLLNSLKTLQIYYQKITQNLNEILKEPDIYDFATIFENVKALNRLGNIYITQVVVDGIDFLDLNYIDTTGLVSRPQIVFNKTNKKESDWISLSFLLVLLN